MFTIYLGLGSNIGNKLRYLSDAVIHLQRVITIQSISSVYETDPIGMVSEEKFLNMAIKAKTDLFPLELLSKIKNIEQILGRTLQNHMKPREIDVDILLYENFTFANELVEIPHPRMIKRRFVLAPLSEIASDVQHQLEKKTVRELLKNCADTSKVLPTELKLLNFQLP